MSIEAMKLALEALENNKRTHYYCEDTWYSCPKHEDGCANEAEGDKCNCGADRANAEIDKAITALRQAIEQAEQSQPKRPQNCGTGYCSCIECVMEPEQAQPVVTAPCKGMNCGCTDGLSHSLECQAEHAAAIAGGVFVKAEQAQPVAKPLCKVGGMPAPGRMCPKVIVGGKLCGFTGECEHKQVTTSPPPRQPWVGLTDEQWKQKLGDRQLFTILEAIRFVETVYGIKGEA